VSDNVAAQGEHDRMCPVYVAMPENQCGYCHLIARVREDERANLYTMGQLADRFEESYEEGRKEGYARGLIEGDSGGRREGYRSGYAAGKDAVMTDSYAQAVAVGQRDERERWEAEGPWFKSVVHQCCEDKETAYAKGYAAALDAATEAVALLLRSWGRVTDPEAEDMILDAIAALRGES